MRVRQATARVIPARQPRTGMPPTAVQARRLLRNRPSQEAAARIPRAVLAAQAGTEGPRL